MVEGTCGAKDDLTETPATDAHPYPGRVNMGPPPKAPQNSPAPSDGWGVLPWGGLPGFMTQQQGGTAAHTNPRREDMPPAGSNEPQRVEPFQSVTSDFIVFEEVNGKWRLQPAGLQVETRSHAQQPVAMTQGEGTPPIDQICNITAEDVLWIHTILNPQGLDLRGEGELARVMGGVGGWPLGWDPGIHATQPPHHYVFQEGEVLSPTRQGRMGAASLVRTRADPRTHHPCLHLVWPASYLSL